MINRLVRFHGFNHDGTVMISEQHSITRVAKISGTPIVQSTLPIALANRLPTYVFNADIFKQVLSRWIIVHNIAFYHITAPEFRALLMYLYAVVCINTYLK